MRQIPAVEQVLPLLPGFHADTVDTVDTFRVEVGNRQGCAKRGGQHDIGIQMQSPGVSREKPLGSLDHQALAELSVLVSLLGEKQFHIPATSEFPRCPVPGSGYNNPTVEVPPVVPGGDFQEIIIRRRTRLERGADSDRLNSHETP